MIIKNINFTGAQGTGKTSVLKALQKDLSFKDYTIVTEVVRNFVKEKGIQINEKGTIETQVLLFEAYKEKLLDENIYPFISDRCIIDVIAYSLQSYGRPVLTEKEIVDWALVLNHQETQLHNLKELFGFVFYFPIEFDIVPDGTRSVDLDYQKAIDTNIRNILFNCKIPYVKVTGTVEERVQIIKDTLSKRNLS